MARILLPEFGLGELDPLRFVPDARREFAAGRQLSATGEELSRVSNRNFAVHRTLAEDQRVQEEREKAAAERFRLQGQTAYQRLAEADIVEGEASAMIDLERQIRSDPEEALTRFESAIRDLGPTDPESLDSDTATAVDEFARKHIAQARLMAVRAVESEKEQILRRQEAERKALEARLFDQRLATEQRNAQADLSEAALQLDAASLQDPEHIEGHYARFLETYESIPGRLDRWHREEMAALLREEKTRIDRNVTHMLHKREVDRAESTYARTLETGLERIRNAPNAFSQIEESNRLESDLEDFLEGMTARGLKQEETALAQLEAAQKTIGLVTTDSLAKTDPAGAALYAASQANLPEVDRIQLLEAAQREVRQNQLDALQSQILSEEADVMAGKTSPVVFNDQIAKKVARVTQDVAAGFIDEPLGNDMLQMLMGSVKRVGESEIKLDQYNQFRYGGAPYSGLLDETASRQLTLELESIHNAGNPEWAAGNWSQAYADSFAAISRMGHLPEGVARTFQDIYRRLGSDASTIPEKQAISKFVHEMTSGPGGISNFFGKLPSELVREMKELGRTTFYSPQTPPENALRLAREASVSRADWSKERKVREEESARAMPRAREIIAKQLAERSIDQPIGFFQNLGFLNLLAPLGVAVDTQVIARNVSPEAVGMGQVNYSSGEVIHYVQRLAVDRYVNGYSDTLEDAIDETTKSVLGESSPVGVTFLTGGEGSLAMKSIEKIGGPIPAWDVELPRGALGDAYEQMLRGDLVTIPGEGIVAKAITTLKGEATGLGWYDRMLDYFHQNYMLQTTPAGPTGEPGAPGPGVLDPRIGLRPSDLQPAEWYDRIVHWGKPIDPQSVDDLRGLLSFEVVDTGTIDKPVLNSRGQVVLGAKGQPITRPVRAYRIAPFLMGKRPSDIMDRRTVPLPDGAGGFVESPTGGLAAYQNHYFANAYGRRATFDVTEELLGLQDFRDLEHIEALRQESGSNVTTRIANQAMKAITRRLGRPRTGGRSLFRESP
jgi:hypothetical protein